jgi:hypothetical protein
MVMRLKDLKKLRVGDEVFWNDPDNDLCSGMFHIQSLGSGIVNMSSVVTLMRDDSSIVEVFARELS